MANILENFYKEYEKDKQNINNDLPDGIVMTEEEKVEYEKELMKQRNIINQVYAATIGEKYDEESLIDNGLISDDDCKVVVRHAKCPYCGGELISIPSPVAREFMTEKICKHKCNCGKLFNLEHKYPRVVYIDNQGNEIKVKID